MRRISVTRILRAVLIFQLGIGAFLVFGDIRQSGFTLPNFGPVAPRLSEPVRPGDQRRTFDPGRDRPPLSPIRNPGELPERLMLTQVDGSTWRLEGAIAEGDAERMITLLDASETAVETLVLQSPGGSVRDALELGRYLRAQNIATKMLEGEFCYSACPYVLSGGSERDIAEGASVGVHQHYFGENTLMPAFVAVEDIQRGQGEVMIYLDDMGIDPLIMQHALTTPADEIYVLLEEELDSYRIRTSGGQQD